MKKLWTKKEILSNKGCYETRQVLQLSFINKTEITLIDILESEISILDKRWFVYNKAELTLDQKKDLCHKLAFAVLPIYEAKYPGDNRVRDCLQGITDFKNGDITKEKLIELRRAAYADAADADAAAAAAAAAYAAAYAAAADAADADAYAADADAYAAAADAADADAYAADADAYAAAAAADADAAAADADADADAEQPKYSDILKGLLIEFVNTEK